MGGAEHQQLIGRDEATVDALLHGLGPVVAEQLRLTDLGAEGDRQAGQRGLRPIGRGQGDRSRTAGEEIDGPVRSHRHPVDAVDEDIAAFGRLGDALAGHGVDPAAAMCGDGRVPALVQLGHESAAEGSGGSVDGDLHGERPLTRRTGGLVVEPARAPVAAQFWLIVTIPVSAVAETGTSVLPSASCGFFAASYLSRSEARSTLPSFDFALIR